MPPCTCSGNPQNAAKAKAAFWEAIIKKQEEKLDRLRLQKYELCTRIRELQVKCSPTFFNSQLRAIDAACNPQKQKEETLACGCVINRSTRTSEEKCTCVFEDAGVTTEEVSEKKVSLMSCSCAGTVKSSSVDSCSCETLPAQDALESHSCTCDISEKRSSFNTFLAKGQKTPPEISSEQRSCICSLSPERMKSKDSSQISCNCDEEELEEQNKSEICSCDIELSESPTCSCESLNKSVSCSCESQSEKSESCSCEESLSEKLHKSEICSCDVRSSKNSSVKKGTLSDKGTNDDECTCGGDSVYKQFDDRGSSKKSAGSSRKSGGTVSSCMCSAEESNATKSVDDNDGTLEGSCRCDGSIGKTTISFKESGSKRSDIKKVELCACEDSSIGKKGIPSKESGSTKTGSCRCEDSIGKKGIPSKESGSKKSDIKKTESCTCEGSIGKSGISFKESGSKKSDTKRSIASSVQKPGSPHSCTCDPSALSKPPGDSAASRDVSSVKKPHRRNTGNGGTHEKSTTARPSTRDSSTVERPEKRKRLVDAVCHCNIHKTDERSISGKHNIGDMVPTKESKPCYCASHLPPMEPNAVQKPRSGPGTAVIQCKCKPNFEKESSGSIKPVGVAICTDGKSFGGAFGTWQKDCSCGLQSGRGDKNNAKIPRNDLICCCGNASNQKDTRYTANQQIYTANKICYCGPVKKPKPPELTQKPSDNESELDRFEKSVLEAMCRCDIEKMQGTKLKVEQKTVHTDYTTDFQPCACSTFVKSNSVGTDYTAAETVAIGDIKSTKKTIANKSDDVSERDRFEKSAVEAMCRCDLEKMKDTKLKVLQKTVHTDYTTDFKPCACGTCVKSNSVGTDYTAAETVAIGDIKNTRKTIADKSDKSDDVSQSKQQKSVPMDYSTDFQPCACSTFVEPNTISTDYTTAETIAIGDVENTQKTISDGDKTSVFTERSCTCDVTQTNLDSTAKSTIGDVEDTTTNASGATCSCGKPDGADIKEDGTHMSDVTCSCGSLKSQTGIEDGGTSVSCSCGSSQSQAGVELDTGTLVSCSCGSNRSQKDVILGDAERINKPDKTSDGKYIDKTSCECNIEGIQDSNVEDDEATYASARSCNCSIGEPVKESSIKEKSIDESMRSCNCSLSYPEKDISLKAKKPDAQKPGTGPFCTCSPDSCSCSVERLAATNRNKDKVAPIESMKSCTCSTSSEEESSTESSSSTEESSTRSATMCSCASKQEKTLTQNMSNFMSCTCSSLASTYVSASGACSCNSGQFYKPKNKTSKIKDTKKGKGQSICSCNLDRQDSSDDSSDGKGPCVAITIRGCNMSPYKGSKTKQNINQASKVGCGKQVYISVPLSGCSSPFIPKRSCPKYMEMSQSQTSSSRARPESGASACSQAKSSGLKTDYICYSALFQKFDNKTASICSIESKKTESVTISVSKSTPSIFSSGESKKLSTNLSDLIPFSKDFKLYPNISNETISFCGPRNVLSAMELSRSFDAQKVYIAVTRQPKYINKFSKGCNQSCCVCLTLDSPSEIQHFTPNASNIPLLSSYCFNSPRRTVDNGCTPDEKRPASKVCQTRHSALRSQSSRSRGNKPKISYAQTDSRCSVCSCSLQEAANRDLEDYGIVEEVTIIDHHNDRKHRRKRTSNESQRKSREEKLTKRKEGVTKNRPSGFESLSTVYDRYVSKNDWMTSQGFDQQLDTYPTKLDRFLNKSSDFLDLCGSTTSISVLLENKVAKYTVSSEL